MGAMSVLSREKHPLHQLHLKKGRGLFSRVGLFYGTTLHVCHCKNRLVVLTAEWLPWLHGLLWY